MPVSKEMHGGVRRTLTKMIARVSSADCAKQSNIISDVLLAPVHELPRENGNLRECASSLRMSEGGKGHVRVGVAERNGRGRG